MGQAWQGPNAAAAITWAAQNREMLDAIAKRMQSPASVVALEQLRRTVIGVNEQALRDIMAPYVDRKSFLATLDLATVRPFQEAAKSWQPLSPHTLEALQRLSSRSLLESFPTESNARELVHRIDRGEVEPELMAAIEASIAEEPLLAEAVADAADSLAADSDWLSPEQARALIVLLVYASSWFLMMTVLVLLPPMGALMLGSSGYGPRDAARKAGDLYDKHLSPDGPPQD